MSACIHAKTPYYACSDYDTTCQPNLFVFVHVRHKQIWLAIFFVAVASNEKFLFNVIIL